MINIHSSSSVDYFFDLIFGDIFKDSEITEVAINKVGEIWFEKRSYWEKINSDKVTFDLLDRFSNAIASFSNNKLDKNNPILSATLPNEERIQIIKPPACDKTQYSITIRKPNKTIFPMQVYKENGFFDNIVIGKREDKNNIELNEFLNKKDYLAFFDLAVKCGTKNIIIAGATGSGKTTFMKSLIISIPKHERLITIEDVREIQSDEHQNMVNLIYPSEKNNQKYINPTGLLKSCLRMKPDRILLAELRGGETYDYLNVISSGHGGSITSLHAGSYDEVMMRLVSMAQENEASRSKTEESLINNIKQSIDIIAIIENHEGKRFIKELYFKDFKQGKVNA